MSTEAELKAKYETLNTKAVEAYNRKKEADRKRNEIAQNANLTKLELKC